MAGYIGSKASVTQVDGYNRTEADAEFVNDPNSVISVSGSNVGIGTSSPTNGGVIGGKSLHVSATGETAGVRVENTTATIGGYLVTASGNNSHVLFGTGAKPLIFYTNSAEAMRIESGGDVLLGSGSGSNSVGPKFYGGDLNTGNNGLGIWPEGNGSSVVKILSGVNSTSGRIHVRFTNPNGTCGQITTSGSATSYATASDYRLKTDAQPMTGASARVQALNPVNFEWIADGTRVDGFLAHEAQAVVPEAVHGTKDAMRDEEYEVTPAVLDEDGNVVTEAVMGTRSVPDYQGIDQSKLVPLLTAALQEALTEIADLKARVTALEAV